MMYVHGENSLRYPCTLYTTHNCVFVIREALCQSDMRRDCCNRYLLLCVGTRRGPVERTERSEM